MTTETFGQRLTRLREASGLSAVALAVAAETSVATVSRLESGRRQPSLAMASRLAHALGRKLRAWEGCEF